MSHATDSPGMRLENILGQPDETAPASDTASSGLNGRMQRIAQRLTTLDGRVDGLEAAIGAIADAAVIDPSASGSLIALTKGVLRGVGVGYSASASFTPAATSHTAGDVNGGAQQFTFSATPPSGCNFLVHTCAIRIDGGTAEATAWTAHLYNATPPSAIADDAAWDVASGDRSAYLGSISLGTAVDVGSTQYLFTHNVNAQFKLLTSNLFAYLVNGTTLTPAAVAHVVTLVGRVI